MLKTRTRRLDRRRENAERRLAEIENAVISLDDEDILDLADIFKKQPLTPLGEIAFAEMVRRGISL